MPIIKPSLTFEGSDLGLTSSTNPYIKEEVRRLVFNKTTNQDGAHLFFLPPYKEDGRGSGVWYKTFTVRDNFGTGFKEKYYVPNKEQDPAEYFAKNFSIIYPDETKVVDEEKNGKIFKRYPNYGRLARRVVYNVAYAENLELGAHVLDLPIKNGADQLHTWLSGKDFAGHQRPCVNDPERCIPVFVQLRVGSSPWYITVDASQTGKLPEQLSNSEYLYNLDEIFVPKSQQEIISKLRESFPGHVFDECMDGYPGLVKPRTQGLGLGVQKPKAAVEEAPAPTTIIPKAAIAKAVMTPVVVDDLAEETHDDNPSTLPRNPMASGSLTKEQAMAFLKGNK